MYKATLQAFRRKIDRRLDYANHIKYEPKLCREGISRSVAHQPGYLIVRYFGNKQEIKRADPLGDSQHLQEAIIEKSKALIIVHNRIVQEEAKYNYLKNSLVTMTQNQSLDTLPRPHITR